jgi:C4-dicarboxylate transporter, DctM subunit
MLVSEETFDMSTEVVTAIAPRPAHFLDLLEKKLKAITRPLATLGVLGMLLAATAIVFDVTLREVAGSGVTALNEITALAFAIAITACLPAGLADGVNLKIDIFSRWITGRLAIWLDAIGGLALLVLFAILAQQIYIYAEDLSAAGRTTVILGWRQAPTMYTVAALLTFAVVVQLVICLNAIRRAWNYTDNGARTYPVVTAMACVLGAIVLVLGAYCIYDFAGVARWASSNPGKTVTAAFFVMWVLMLGMMPLAALSGLVGILGTALFIGFSPAYSAFSTEATGLLTNSQIATLPLFLMMGSFAAVSGMADDLYRLANLLFGRFRGGLAYATIGSCAGFGALTGSSLATAATVGRVAIPEMRSRGYSPALATGVCAAGGTLGPIVPPGSGPIIVFALLTEASIGKLFVASVGPALLTILFYLITIKIYINVSPKSVPALAERVNAAELRAVLRNCIPIRLLVFGIMGGLYFGFFTDTESAAVGAIGAFICAVFRRKLNRGTFFEVMVETTATTAMVYSLIIGAQAFSFFVSVSSLTEAASSFVSSLQWPPVALVFVILAGYLLLGMIMESYAILIITVPIITPLITGLGYDIIWWGIIMLCVVETGMIHPPFGLNVIVLKGVTPDIPIWTIYKGVTPFVFSDLLKLVILILLPIITLWLPLSMAK